MPAKYSHVKRRSASGLLRKEGSGYVKDMTPPHHHHPHHAGRSNPLVDRSISQAMSAVSHLERDIARILLIRYEQDIARLFSTRLYSIALVHLPTFVMRCVSLYGPSWLVHNHDCEEIKDFFRAAVGMDMRQAGERVATKSVLWSYTALRHFAMSNNVPICTKRGLHTLRLLPYHPALKSHLDALGSAPPAAVSKPPHLGSLHEGQEALKEACELKFGILNRSAAADWESEHKVLHLLQAIYGLKQAARAWWIELVQSMKKLGFVRIFSDSGVFIHCDTKTGTLVIALIYIDDSLFAGPNQHLAQNKKAEFMKIWDCRDLVTQQNSLA